MNNDKQYLFPSGASHFFEFAFNRGIFWSVNV